jgi:hypothetical protein
VLLFGLQSVSTEKPGQQAEYLDSIERNNSGGRSIIVAWGVAKMKGERRFLALFSFLYLWT